MVRYRLHMARYRLSIAWYRLSIAWYRFFTTWYRLTETILTGIGWSRWVSDWHWFYQVRSRFTKTLPETLTETRDRQNWTRDQSRRDWRYGLGLANCLGSARIGSGSIGLRVSGGLGAGA